jgi:hypothetical protein
MLYAIGFIGLFTAGGMTGLMLAAMGLDMHLHDTYFIIAHSTIIMVGGMVLAFMGGLHYWWPKITGRLYPEFIAKIAAIVTFLGFNLTFFPQFILGYLGMPRRYHAYPEFGCSRPNKSSELAAPDSSLSSIRFRPRSSASSAVGFLRRVSSRSVPARGRLSALSCELHARRLLSARLGLGRWNWDALQVVACPARWMDPDSSQRCSCRKIASLQTSGSSENFRCPAFF